MRNQCLKDWFKTQIKWQTLCLSIISIACFSTFLKIWNGAWLGVYWWLQIHCSVWHASSHALAAGNLQDNICICTLRKNLSIIVGSFFGAQFLFWGARPKKTLVKETIKVPKIPYLFILFSSSRKELFGFYTASLPKVRSGCQQKILSYGEASIENCYVCDKKLLRAVELQGYNDYWSEKI